MTSDQLKKLRAYYHSLRNLQPVFEHAPNGIVSEASVRVFEEVLQRIEGDFKGLLPKLDTMSHRSKGNATYFYSNGMQTLLAVALGHLDIAVEEDSSAPVTELKEFSFVKNSALREIIERDYQELQQAYVAKCWKSVIILAGGAVEAILTDLLLQRDDNAKASTKAPRNKEGKVLDLPNWGLVHLILVSVDLKLVTPGVERLSHPIREYRDLVHPMVEIKTSLHVGAEEARIGVEVVSMVHRDLSK
jgi:hypothetical protein